MNVTGILNYFYSYGSVDFFSLIPTVYFGDDLLHITNISVADLTRFAHACI